MTGIKSITNTTIPTDTPPPTTNQQQNIQQAYQQQETIGWHNLLISIQDEHYDRNNFGKKLTLVDGSTKSLKQQYSSQENFGENVVKS